MSVQAVSSVLRDGPRMADVDRRGRKYGARARGMRAVLMTIADAANRDGEHAHPGVRAIVEGSLYSKPHALAIIDELVAEGWLEVTERGVGRGNATVYRVVLDRRARAAAGENVWPSDHSQNGEKVGSTPDQSGDGKGRISDEKRSDLDDEKVGSGGRAPISQPKTSTEEHNSGAEAPTAKPTDDPIVKRAHELAVLAFEQTVKPAIAAHGRGSPFAAVMANIETVLRAGHPDTDLEAAIRNGDVFAWTVSAITVAIAKSQRSRGRPTVTTLRSARDRAAARDDAAAGEAAS